MGKKKKGLSIWQIAKLAWQIYKSYRGYEKMVKDGKKTSEFWMTIITVIGLVLQAVMGMLPPDKVAILATILVGIYTIARAVVKMTASKTDDEIVAKIGEEIISKLPDVDNE